MTPTARAEQIVERIEGLAHRLHQCDEGGCGYVVQAREVITTALQDVERETLDDVLATFDGAIALSDDLKLPSMQQALGMIRQGLVSRLSRRSNQESR